MPFLADREALSVDDRLSVRPPGPVAVLYIDVDRLKSINDYLGHCAGDWFIRVFAQRLRVKVGRPGVIARIGGDEFVFVPNQPMSAARHQETHEDDARLVAGARSGYLCRARWRRRTALSMPRARRPTLSWAARCFSHGTPAGAGLFV
jgi:GGDEF domain-containing protein